MKKIKVMNLIWSMGAGGAQQIIINYLRAFHNDPDLDFRVYVFTGPSDSKYDREIKEKNYKVTYLNYPRPKLNIPYIRYFFQRSVCIRHWEAAIRDFQPDIVHVHISALLQHTLPAIMHTNIPVRLDTLHSNPHRYKGRLRRIISDAFQNQNFIPVCLTEEQAHMAKDWYGIKHYELVRNGLDIQGLQQACCSRQEARALFGLDEDSFVVVGVGRLEPIKNYPLMINAFAELLRTQPDAKLLIAGAGVEKPKLLRLVKEKHLEDHVVFLGYVEDVAKLYCAADVLAITSVTESLSLVAVEAQICGLRCVLSDGVPAESILLECSRKVSPNATLEEWANALLDTEYHGSATIPMELFDVHKVNQQMKDIYLNYHRQAVEKHGNHGF